MGQGFVGKRPSLACGGLLFIGLLVVFSLSPRLAGGKEGGREAPQSGVLRPLVERVCARGARDSPAGCIPPFWREGGCSLVPPRGSLPRLQEARPYATCNRGRSVLGFRPISQAKAFLFLFFAAKRRLA